MFRQIMDEQALRKSATNHDMEDDGDSLVEEISIKDPTEISSEDNEDENVDDNATREIRSPTRLLDVPLRISS